MICESDIINTILSYSGMDIKSLLSIKYYNERAELLIKPNEPLSKYTNNIHSLKPGGFFVITITEGDFDNDYRLYYSDFIKELRGNKLNELGI